MSKQRGAPGTRFIFKSPPFPSEPGPHAQHLKDQKCWEGKPRRLKALPLRPAVCPGHSGCPSGLRLPPQWCGAGEGGGSRSAHLQLASCHDSRHSPTPSLWPPWCVHSSTFPRAGPGALRPHPALMDGAAPRQEPYPSVSQHGPSRRVRLPPAHCGLGLSGTGGRRAGLSGRERSAPQERRAGTSESWSRRAGTVRLLSECPPHPPPAPTGPGLRLAPRGLRPLLRQAPRLGTGGASPYTGPSPPPLTRCPLPGGLVQ